MTATDAVLLAAADAVANETAIRMLRRLRRIRIRCNPDLDKNGFDNRDHHLIPVAVTDRLPQLIEKLFSLGHVIGPNMCERYLAQGREADRTCKAFFLSSRYWGSALSIAGLISWRVAISNYRQAWINALRDDLATYLKELEIMHYEIARLFSAKTDDSTLERQKHETRIAILFT